MRPKVSLKEVLQMGLVTRIIRSDGAMAQLGARLHGMQKVASSSLAGSSRKSRARKRLAARPGLHIEHRRPRRRRSGATPNPLSGPKIQTTCLTFGWTWRSRRLRGRPVLEQVLTLMLRPNSEVLPEILGNRTLPGHRKRYRITEDQASLVALTRCCDARGRPA